MTLFLRGSLLALALFLLANALGTFLHPRFDQSIWLIDLRALPAFLRAGVLILCAVSFAALSTLHAPSIEVKTVGFACLSLLFIEALWHSIQFYRLWHVGQFTPAIPIPLTVCFAAGLLVMALMLARGTWTISTWRWLPFSAGSVCVLLTLPLSQMLFFGTSDYRRSTDAIVVLGARVYADGRLSDALTDRMRTAVQLYHEGHAPLLVVSGGPGDGLIYETEAMRTFAIKNGVPASAILLDPEGLNTEATARNAATILTSHRLGSVLAVSHAYHLPRVKMTLERCAVRTYTVPAQERYTLRKMPVLIAREVAALWVYYAAPQK